MFSAFSIYMFVTIPFYALAIYMIAYTSNHLHLPRDQALQINSIAMVAMFLLIYPAAKMADKIGRKKVLMGAIIAMLLFTYPAFTLMQSGEFWQVAAGQSILALILGWYLAPVPALLVEMFPTSIRYTGISLSYNLCAIVGGFTPAIAEKLIEKTHDEMSIMFLLIGAGVMSLIALWRYKDNWRGALV
jgi:MHS family proline/betaine transporter-like MFS transporter